MIDMGGLSPLSMMDMGQLLPLYMMYMIGVICMMDMRAQPTVYVVYDGYGSAQPLGMRN